MSSRSNWFPSLCHDGEVCVATALLGVALFGHVGVDRAILGGHQRDGKARLDRDRVHLRHSNKQKPKLTKKVGAYFSVTEFAILSKSTRPFMAGSSQHGKQRLASVASNWVVAAYLKGRYFAITIVAD